LYQQHKGKIDADFGRLAFTTPPLAKYHSLDAKYTTTDLARQLKTWAIYGPPLGRTWQPTEQEKKLYPEVRPLVSNPWTILHAQPPAAAQVVRGLSPVDLRTPMEARDSDSTEKEERRPRPPTAVAWHGTLLPRNGADVWLAAAFA